MEIIYCCYGGTHSSPVAAAIHLGRLDPHQVPTGAEISSIELYDRVPQSQRGKVMFVGEVDWGNRIYVCGRGRDKYGIEQAVKSGVLLAGGTPDRIWFVDTLPAVNWLMRIGGFMSRRLGWVKIGRPLLIKGTQKAFFNLAEIVSCTRAMCAPPPKTGGPG